MRAARNKMLGAAEGLGEVLAFSGGQAFFEADEVLGLLFFNMGGEVFPEGFDGGHEFGVGGGHVLEFVKLLLDLCEGMVVSRRYESSNIAEKIKLGSTDGVGWSSEQELSLPLDAPHGLSPPNSSRH